MSKRIECPYCHEPVELVDLPFGVGWGIGCENARCDESPASIGQDRGDVITDWILMCHGTEKMLKSMDALLESVT